MVIQRLQQITGGIPRNWERSADITPKSACPKTHHYFLPKCFSPRPTILLCTPRSKPQKSFPPPSPSPLAKSCPWAAPVFFSSLPPLTLQWLPSSSCKSCTHPAAPLTSLLIARLADPPSSPLELLGLRNHLLVPWVATALGIAHHLRAA